MCSGHRNIQAQTGAGIDPAASSLRPCPGAQAKAKVGVGSSTNSFIDAGLPINEGCSVPAPDPSGLTITFAMHSKRKPDSGQFSDDCRRRTDRDSI